MLKTLLFCSALAASVALAPTVSQAAIVAFDVNTTYSGLTSQGTAPYIRIEFDDQVAPGFVRMTGTATGINSAEWIARLHLNVDPALGPNTTTFSNFVVNSGVLLQPVIVRGNDVADAGGGGGLFDVEFQFAVSGGGLTRRWNLGESFSFDISGLPGLTANSFNVLSSGPAPNGVQFMSAEIQGIGADALDGWHSVPEPSAACALLAALGATGMARRRCRR